MGGQLISDIVHELDRLPDDEQQRVLQFVRALASVQPAGMPGTEMIRLAGLIPTDDLREMAQAIKAGCEQVDEREW